MEDKVIRGALDFAYGWYYYLTSPLLSAPFHFWLGLVVSFGSHNVDLMDEKENSAGFCTLLIAATATR
jgi:hypothetical protein